MRTNPRTTAAVGGDKAAGNSAEERGPMAGQIIKVSDNAHWLQAWFQAMETSRKDWPTNI